MRVRLAGVIAAVAAVALATFAATGFGGEGSAVRSLDTGFATSRVDVDDLHRVAAPTGQASASALGRASGKGKGKKPKILFFETVRAIPIPAGAAQGAELECPKGKVISGYFLAGNEDTFLGLSAPLSRVAWVLGLRNTDAAATEAIFGIVCAKGVKSPR